MTTVLERVREALAPQYRVEREIARGGMGIVFLAHEAVLDRSVAIKVVRPELATAHAVDKFLREARILANLRHPNVIPVHRADEADGFFYYAMDYIDGETLADRLTTGPLKPNEVLKLGRDLLDALDAVHGVGVVHRDIKPSNILLVDGRAILTDFGIARPSRDPNLTASQPGIVGTVGYMPPEQAYGWEVTPRTDLFAVAAVLYEAYTGRRWGDQRPDKKPDWSCVPRKVVPILRRGLVWEPSERWPDATSFRHKLWRTRTTRYRRRTLLLTVGGVVTGAVLMTLMTARVDRMTANVAILPFVADSGVESNLTDELTELTDHYLRDFSRTASHESQAAWDAAGRSIQAIDVNTLELLGTESLVHARVSAIAGDTSIKLVVMRSDGVWRPAGTVHMNGTRTLDAVGSRIGQEIVGVIDPNREWEFGGSHLSDIDPATRLYLGGQMAFRRNQFQTATDHFHAALSLDSTFGTAEWWFSNSWRWLLQGRPAPDVDLPALLEARGPDLPELDRWLIEAQKDTTETGRMAAYKKTVEHYPHDAYAQFLYADEMLTRGALIGIPLDSAILELELAASMDSTFGPAHLDLVWSYLRLGPRDSAEASLRRYQSVYAAEEGVTVTDTIWYDILIQERFELGSAQEQLTDMLADSPIMRDTLLSYFRLLGIWDMALFQASLSEIVLDDAAAIEPGMRAHLHEGLGLALIGLGRISQGLQHIDSAATLLDIDSARLEAAEWRVVAPALGLPGVAEAEIERGRTVLYQLLSEPNSRARAAWALGVDAAHRGDTVATQVWIDTLQAIPSDTSAERLAVLLRAIDRGAQGDWQVALDSSHSALQFDSAGRGGDPFARATLHMKRAQWHDSLGHPHEADAARMWYEHFEFLGSPQGEAQASEVDWALSPLARMQRGRAAAVRGRDTLWSRLIQLLPWIKGNREHRTKACSFFSRLAELWIDADPAYDSFKTEIEDYLERRCR